MLAAPHSIHGWRCGHHHLQVQIGAASLSMRASAAEASKIAGRWGTTASRIEPAVSKEEINDLKQTWVGLAEQFRMQLIEFLRALPAAADEVSFCKERSDS